MRHRPNRIPRTLRTVCAAVALAWAAAGARPALAGIQAAILPGTTNVPPGTEFDVTIDVPQAGSAFNAFRATVTYDTTMLTFLPAAWTANQQGPLMTGACGATFHQFAVYHDTLVTYTSLLCDQVSLTGPGTIYKLRFRARNNIGVTWIRLASAIFYDAGLRVSSVTTADARVGIGVSLDAGDPSPPRPGLRVAAEPNPARGRLALAIESDRAGAPSIEVHDLAGRLVRRLDGAWRGPGASRVAWDGTDGSGARVRPGVYLVTVRTGDRVARTRVAMLQ